MIRKVICPLCNLKQFLKANSLFYKFSEEEREVWFICKHCGEEKTAESMKIPKDEWVKAERIF